MTASGRWAPIKYEFISESLNAIRQFRVCVRYVCVRVLGIIVRIKPFTDKVNNNSNNTTNTNTTTNNNNNNNNNLIYSYPLTDHTHINVCIIIYKADLYMG